MLTFEQIKELIELVGQEKLEGLEIERSGFRLKIAGHTPARAVSYAAPPPPAPAPAAALPAPVVAPTAAPAAAGEAPEEESLPEGAHVLHSPIVGTFYVAPSQDAEAYVAPGDRVKQGQVLCIVEAMKLMNEIEADVDGVVLRIIPKNAQPVEFGEPLFVIEPA